VIEYPAERRVQPGNAEEAVRRENDQQGDRADEIGLGAGYRSTPDDRSDRDRCGDVDDGPLCQRAPLPNT
jgi:hypothetical protein